MSQNNDDQPGLWPAAEPPPRPRRTTRPAASVTPQRGRVNGGAPQLPARRPRKPSELPGLWDIDQVANYLGVPKQTIYA